MAGTLWLLPAIPGLSALVLFLVGGRLPRRFVSWQACLSVLAAFGLSVAALVRLAGEGPFHLTLLPWIAGGVFKSSFVLTFDALAAIMCLVVTGVGFLIHVYSVGYMSEEKSLSRYFGQLNLFTFFMLLLVLAGDIVLLFVGWEGVGLCSYLLIGFWFERPAAAAAGKKAFLVNRVGDAAFLIGLLVLVQAAGSGEIPALREAVSSGALAPTVITLAALLLFAGATGKSAQIPLYIWLPDAMEGPTPVSALIHAATMVTAGVYLVARLSFLFTASPAALAVVGAIGAVTAVFAGTMALVQNDIKRVLAYSTVSQIGYMFIGCGAGAYAAGIFHLFTHAFFKSLLFLGAGSVIHALAGEQDIRKMGGLRKHLPRTFPAFLIAALAIAGLPFLSGFFSKDGILTAAFAAGRYDLWILGLLGAVLTAFYMFRLVFLVFYGEERLGEKVRGHIHESPAVMTTPLLILAFFSAAAGYLGLPAVVGERADVIGRFLEPALVSPETHHLAGGAEWLLLLLSAGLAIIGIFIAYIFYLKRPQLPSAVAARFPWLYKLLANKYYVDEAYAAVILKPAERGAETVYKNFDLKVIDGAVNASGAAARQAGKLAGRLQTGLVKDYVLAFLAGAILFLGVLLLG